MFLTSTCSNTGADEHSAMLLSLASSIMSKQSQSMVRLLVSHIRGSKLFWQVLLSNLKTYFFWSTSFTFKNLKTNSQNVHRILSTFQDIPPWQSSSSQASPSLTVIPYPHVCVNYHCRNNQEWEWNDLSTQCPVSHPGLSIFILSSALRAQQLLHFVQYHQPQTFKNIQVKPQKSLLA